MEMSDLAKLLMDPSVSQITVTIDMSKIRKSLVEDKEEENFQDPLHYLFDPDTVLLTLVKRTGEWIQVKAQHVKAGMIIREDSSREVLDIWSGAAVTTTDAVESKNGVISIQASPYRPRKEETNGSAGV